VLVLWGAQIKQSANTGCWHYRRGCRGNLELLLRSASFFCYNVCNLLDSAGGMMLCFDCKGVLPADMQEYCAGGYWQPCAHG
jgi:hypothetical protein